MMYKSIRILLLALLLIGTNACQQQNPPSDAVAENGASVHDEKPDANSDEVSSSETNASQASDQTKNILIFGDSITAGYGLEAEQAFPALIQDKIDALDWNYKIVNGGLSGDTSAGGVRRISWMLREPVDILVLELGGNDGLRGTPPEATKQNLQDIIDEVKSQNEEVVIILAGMQIPPNLGQEYTTKFKNVFPDLAAENNAMLIPFLLEDVGGVPSLNQPDGIHPTAEGHKIVAENVWKILKPLLAAQINA
ncbi:MAG: arylesterase [Rhodothermales bacterium]